MRYAVLGAGGIGGLVGGALARAGHPVTLIVREESAHRHPPTLSVSSKVLGDFEAPVTIATRLLDRADVVWVTVKATQLEAALAAVPPEQLAEALLIPLMNGVDHVARLRETYPAANVVAGSIRVESELTAPGEVRQLSPFAAIQLAAAGLSGPRVLEVAEEVGRTGLACEVVDDEASMLWGKLAFLAPLALTTTAKSASLGEVRSDPRWRNRLESCLTEACRAAQSNDARTDREQTLGRLLGAPEAMRSSMQKDVDAGRRPELDAIGGPVVRAGRAQGFDVSTTEELMATIAALVSRA